MGPNKSTCQLCGTSSALVSKVLGVCKDCIRTQPEKALHIAKKAHAISKTALGLPVEPPHAPSGVRCGICAHECQIPSGEKGYCGLRMNEDGKLVHLAGTPEVGIVQCYYDPLPTNCVAMEFCAAGAGSENFSHSKEGPEYGYKNLAVFYGACSFDCLFCQNWHFREQARHLKPTMSARDLAEHVDRTTSCICYFGGDPSPQMPHAVAASRIAVEENTGILRICWESNGNMSAGFLRQAAELSMQSGGTIKIDLKAWDENLNIALCGVTNKHTLKNFEWLAGYGTQRPEPKFLTASTLLVPGYVDAVEVENIARFISELDDGIPYNLLAFYPQFYMGDMPTTPILHAQECVKAAQAYLKNVRIGNVHLLT